MGSSTLQQALEVGLQHHLAGRFAQAEQIYRQMMTQYRDQPDPLHLLGVLTHQLGRTDQAVDLIRRAIAIDPNVPNYHNSLGLVLMAMRRFDEAIPAFQTSLRLNPNLAEAHLNLGIVYHQQGMLDQAAVSYQNVLRLKPNDPTADGNLGNVLKDQGNIQQAIDLWRKAMSLDRNPAGHHSSICHIMQMDPSFDPREVFEEHRRWNQQHAEPLKRFIRQHENDRDPDRRLRVGYVSPDFREHPIIRFILPLLENHDPKSVETICYSDVAVPDRMTQRAHTMIGNGWRNIVGMNDEQVADLIRADRVDVLVDLSLHTAGNRLLVFARRPAPVQVSYLSYPGTSGMDAIDYRLTDPQLDPSDSDLTLYSERSIHLPKVYWCYQPHEPSPAVNDLPALFAGHITFGCLNQFCKISKSALMTWSRLLKSIPNSRLILHTLQDTHRQQILDLFAGHGVDSARLTFLGLLPIDQYLAAYNQIDIALDSFPYNGGTTTCDAMWMGVPVVNLTGKTAVRRAGFTLLNNVGMPQLVAHSEEEYLQIAIKLTGDLPLLAETRATLRQRMQSSPLMDAPGFARDVESAYRDMWKQYVKRP